MLDLLKRTPYLSHRLPLACSGLAAIRGAVGGAHRAFNVTKPMSSFVADYANVALPRLSRPAAWPRQWAAPHCSICAPDKVGAGRFRIGHTVYTH